MISEVKFKTVLISKLLRIVEREKPLKTAVV